MLILIKFWRELIILILVISCFTCYFNNKKKSVKDPSQIQIQKVVNEVAIRRVIEEELIKIRSELKQIKVKDTIKLPNGKIKTHEVTQIEKSDIKTDNTSKKEFDVQSSNALTNSTIKSSVNYWAFSLDSGLKKTDVRDIKNISDISWYASVELKKNWTDHFSSFVQTQYEDLNSPKSPISLKLGVIKFEFKF